VLRLLDSNHLFDADARAALAKEPNLAHALVDRIHRTLVEEVREGRLPELAMTSMDRTIAELLECQGGSERIKRTPMPPAYGLIAHYLTLSFGLVFPLTLHDDLDLWVVPLNMLVAGSFLFVNELGRVLEDPFDIFWNALPLMALSRTMEANARARARRSRSPAAREARRQRRPHVKRPCGSTLCSRLTLARPRRTIEPCPSPRLAVSPWPSLPSLR
jgi:predicted membrane chloride channel (bestrophin family)